MTATSMQPVLILGGHDNALSIARSLGRKGVPIFLSVEKGSAIVYSRYCARHYEYSSRSEGPSYWKRLLIEDRAPELKDIMLLACSDEAVEFVARFRNELGSLYLLDLMDPDIHLAMLDKSKTYALARQQGCAVPGTVDVIHNSKLGDLLDGLQFPLMVKPKFSHLFQQAFSGRKYLIASDESELDTQLAQVRERDVDVMLCELIPGPDSLLCSYYTYIDEQGRILFHYTKSIIRRHPVNEGTGVYQATGWNHEVAEEGVRFFAGIGYRGLGNVEFKRDPRDGRLKVIECNPRFTGAQELLVRSGFDVANFVYERLSGREPPVLDEYRDDVRLWHPLSDFRAFRDLRRSGDLSLMQWLRSISKGRKVYPMFAFDDPAPSLVKNSRTLKTFVSNRLGLQ